MVIDVSPREREVLELLGERLTNAEIGARLYISVRTVESHVSSLLRRSGATDRRELAALAAAESAPTGASTASATPTPPGAAATSVGAATVVGSPRPITSFVGRDDLLDEIAVALTTARIVTLTGPGGIGKTRAALEASGRVAGRQAWFVDLLSAVPARSVLRNDPKTGRFAGQNGVVALAVATAVGAVERPGQELLDTIGQHLAGGPALVLLDNCEHVLDDAADVAAALARVEGVSILATSREPLGIAGERVVAVTPMDFVGADAPAVRLFVDRAAAAGAPLDGGASDVIEEICQRLDGLPLAIELAAARSASLGVDGVGAAIGDRLRLLVGARGADARHRSLRAVLDWSYDLLDDEERSVLRRSAVFSGGFTPADVAVVAAVDDHVALDVLGRLAAKSLLVRWSTDGTSRYRMLDTVHAYAGDRLDESGERPDATAGLLARAVDLAEQLASETLDSGSVPAGYDLAADHFRPAADWGATHDRATTHRLARAAAQLSYARHSFGESQSWYDLAADVAPDGIVEARDRYDAADAALALLRGPEGYQRYVAAAEAAETAGDLGFAAIAWATAVNRAERMPAEFVEPPTRQAMAVMLDHARSVDPDPSPLVLAHIACAAAWASGPFRPSSTMDAAQVALDAARLAGDAVLESDAHDALSCALSAIGDLAGSAQLLADRLVLAERMSPLDPRAGGELLDMLHMACDGPLVLGDIDTALDVAARAIDHPLADGSIHVLHRQQVAALTLAGRFDEAVTEAVAMRSAWEQAGRPTAGWMAPATSLAALAAALRGDDAGWDEWNRMTDEVGVHGTTSAAFAALRLALHRGLHDDAVLELERCDDQMAVAATGEWLVTAENYGGYAWPVAAEVWAVRGEPDAADRLAEVVRECRGHLWCEPTVARIEGRLRGDSALIERSAAGFAAVGAAFEEAATLALLAGRRGDAGRRWLDAAGCEPPAAGGSIG